MLGAVFIEISVVEARTSQILFPLWASLRNDTADRHENHRQFGLTLLDSFDRQKIKSGDQRPLKKRGDTEKPYE